MIHLWHIVIVYYDDKSTGDAEYTIYTKQLESAAVLYSAYKRVEDAGAKRYYVKRFEYLGTAVEV